MSIPGAASPLFLSAAAGAEAAAYQIDRSLRFNSADSSHLTFQPSSAGNRKTWTWSCWLKAPEIVNEFKAIFSAYGGSGNAYFMLDLRDNNPRLISWSGSAINWEVKASAVLRDPSAWYHLVWVVDTTQSTASDRVKLYINGSQQTDFATANYPSQNYNTYVNNTAIHKIGEIGASAYSGFLDGYLADVHFIDGQALAPTDFGEYDSNNVWQPKQFAGTYGSNGWRLDFSDNSSDNALGYDATATTPTLNPRGGMDVITYTGNGTAQTISGLAFQPDLIWIKSRNGSNKYHTIADSVRGKGSNGGYLRMFSNTTHADLDDGGDVTDIFADGFRTTNGSYSNQSSESYVAWCWKAGGPAVLNEDGSIDSQVSVSTDYGFSIVSYTGDGSGTDTIGHGLNTAPSLVITKSRGTTGSWRVFTDVGGTWKLGNLNNTDAFVNATVSAPTSSVFSIDGNSNASTTHIAYCFAPVASYSAFGDFINPSSTDGAFVYCGFKPAFILAKCAENISSSSGLGHWILKDTTRSPYNDPSDGNTLVANVDAAEDDFFNANQAAVDILSNGFKIRHPNSAPLGDTGRRYIFAAFASHPFKTARAR